MYYGWKIVVVAMLAQGVSMGVASYSYGVLVMPMSVEFGASRMEMMWGMTGSTLMTVLISPFFGSLVDRRPAKLLLVCGSLTLATALLLISRAGNVWGFIVPFAIFTSFSAVLLGPIGTNALVARWFSRQRGRALSLTALGTSFGGLLFPVLFQILIDADGWRAACVWVALICIVISLPPILLWVKDRPIDLGLTLDGEALPNEASVSTAASSSIAPAAIDRLFRHGPFWRIGIAVGAMFSAYIALLANLVPYALGQGIASGQAALLISTIAMAGVVGKLLFSIIADRVNLKVTMLITMGMVGLPLLMLALVHSAKYVTMLACAAAVGLAFGALMCAWGALLARIYGPLNYGRVMGWMQPVTVLMVMVAMPLCGYLFDRNGNYSLAFLMLAALLCIAALFLTTMKYEQEAQASAAKIPDQSKMEEASGS